MDDADFPADGFYVLVTGANSGLGLGIGCRLIDEFLHTRPQSQTLVLISTTRDTRKGAATTAAFRKYLKDACRKAERSIPGFTMLLQRRVQFREEILDLTSLLSVQRLATKLKRELPHLDVLICNAGIGGWTGVNWPHAIWTVLTDTVHTTTWPEFKISGVGWVTKPQLPKDSKGNQPPEPPLGEVFCANLFGHYVLGHALMPLLSAAATEGSGRIIWMSSIEAPACDFNADDFQGLKSSNAYESSKRITDMLGMTAEMPSTAPWTSTYFSTTSTPEKHAEAGHEKSSKPRIYITHPGICATGIFPLPWILALGMTAAFWLARWLGSPWHPITAYKGATAPVWVALAEQGMLDAMERREGRGKWGSATDRWGNERVERTEVEGWGWGGKVGEFSKRKGRWRHATDLTAERRAEFEELGRLAWTEMERLRGGWEGRLEGLEGLE
ncbi:3-keto-steroid reductase [Mytilinidion resinicola]|uniref:3-keto-steroid reductase n=1 Tax=Mytilinidion resinicola TaxID=574789 RepID=A0A6A6YTK5_9PEZI|nr:3-keto-steroid reductase [Mytilinidion resinicola]KAF2812101.1 3-keto-steroid reductase [Mytilinidion resinicola]